MNPLVLFEDDHAARFEPVALTRSVASLRCGLWTHRERWSRAFPDRSPQLVCRGYLADVEASDPGATERIAGLALLVAPSYTEGPGLFFDRVLDRGTIVSNGAEYAWTIPFAFPMTDEEHAAIRPGDEVCVG